MLERYDRDIIKEKQRKGLKSNDQEVARSFSSMERGQYCGKYFQEKKHGQYFFIEYSLTIELLFSLAYASK